VAGSVGLGRAATKYIAEALGKGEEEQVPRLIWATVTVQVALGMVGMLILVGITPLLIERTLNIPPALRAEAKTSFYLLALSIPAVFVSSSLTGVLAAAQRFDLVNAVGISLSIVGSLLKLVGVLFWEWHLPEIIAMLIVSRLLALVTYYWLCMCVFPFFKGLPRFYRTELRALIRFGGWLTVSNIIGPLLVYLDRFMLGMLLTMAAVAYYSVPYDMVTRVLIIPTSLVAALFPAFSALLSQGEWERLGYFLSRSVKWVLLTVGPVVVIVVVIGRDILQLWLGPIFAEESTPIRLSRNSCENRTSFRGRPNISNGLARRESEF
jgi:O-antigen/teichoic acid export membrane protein